MASHLSHPCRVDYHLRNWMLLHIYISFSRIFLPVCDDLLEDPSLDCLYLTIKDCILSINRQNMNNSSVQQPLRICANAAHSLSLGGTEMWEHLDSLTSPSIAAFTCLCNLFLMVVSRF